MKKKLIFGFFIALAGNSVFGEELKKAEPCLKSQYQELFQSRLHDLTKSGGVPLFLYDEKKQIIGVADLSVQKITENPRFRMQGVFFCSSIQVDSFEYFSEDSPKFWVQTEENKIEVTQDEGLLVLSAKKESDNGEAVVSKVSYLTYDVFHEDRKTTAEQKASPLYLKDWGFPVGTGVFFVHFPKNLIR